MGKKVLGRRSGRQGFLKREKADLGVYGRGAHFTSTSPGVLLYMCFGWIFLKKSQQGLMKSKSWKTHFSPGQLKLQVSPPSGVCPLWVTLYRVIFQRVQI